MREKNEINQDEVYNEVLNEYMKEMDDGEQVEREKIDEMIKMMVEADIERLQ